VFHMWLLFGYRGQPLAVYLPFGAPSIP
jgi:hypothetical protein